MEESDLSITVYFLCELTCEQVQIIFGTHFLVVYVTIQSFPIRQKLIKMAVLLSIDDSP